MILLHTLVENCKNRFTEYGMDNEQASFEAEMIVRFCAKCDRWKLFLCDCFADDGVAEHIERIIMERLTGVPLQYILGEWDFCGNTFAIGKGVLIPRPETEELTDSAVRVIRERKLTTVYDLCAGSGCIGLSIAKAVPDCSIFSVEKFSVPISYINRNKEHLNIDNVTVICEDVLHPKNMSDLPNVDLIISNPPYIPKNEIPQLQSEVQFEPTEALDGGEDGLLFYRAILRNWTGKLNSPGWIFLECGEGQTDAILSMAKPYGFADSNTFSDMYGTERFVMLEKK